MPSANGLIRTYYASEIALKFKTINIIIALPYCEKSGLQQLKLMAHELTLKGIDSTRILYEAKGVNTRAQALNIANMFEQKTKELAILIVSSPEHMYRSRKSFKKVGFTKVGGMPTFEKTINEESLIDEGGKISSNLSFRYNQKISSRLFLGVPISLP